MVVCAQKEGAPRWDQKELRAIPWPPSPSSSASHGAKLPGSQGTRDPGEGRPQSKAEEVQGVDLRSDRPWTSSEFRVSGSTEERPSGAEHDTGWGHLRVTSLADDWLPRSFHCQGAMVEESMCGCMAVEPSRGLEKRFKRDTEGRQSAAWPAGNLPVSLTC